MKVSVGTNAEGTTIYWGHYGTVTTTSVADETNREKYWFSVPFTAARRCPTCGSKGANMFPAGVYGPIPCPDGWHLQGFPTVGTQRLVQSARNTETPVERTVRELHEASKTR